MEPSETSIPMICLGRKADTGRAVSKHLLPEIEVIRFITEVPIAKIDIPRLLQNQHPTHSSSDDVGSKDYSRPPEAIIAGKGFTEDIIKEIREACENLPRGVLWLVAGLNKEQVERAFGGKPPKLEEYAPMVARATTEVLVRVREEGKGGFDGLHYWST